MRISSDSVNAMVKHKKEVSLMLEEQRRYLDMMLASGTKDIEEKERNSPYGILKRTINLVQRGRNQVLLCSCAFLIHICQPQISFLYIVIR